MPEQFSDSPVLCLDHHTLQNTTVSFVGEMTSVDSASTVATLTVPVAGNHSVITTLDSGAILGTQLITVLPAEPHAPSTAVPEAPMVSHLASQTELFELSSTI
jgi:hypothetical protein